MNNVVFLGPIAGTETKSGSSIATLSPAVQESLTPLQRHYKQQFLFAAAPLLGLSVERTDDAQFEARLTSFTTNVIEGLRKEEHVYACKIPVDASGEIETEFKSARLKSGFENAGHLQILWGQAIDKILTGMAREAAATAELSTPAPL